MSQLYLTTPIYYVNDLPHIGHIYTTLVADTIARWHRFAGDEVYFLTGTDEHGQKIQRAAQEQGLAPIELADKVVERYHQLWGQLGVTHDDFIRTSEARHHAGVQELVRRIADRGDLYVDRHEGWYCSGCEAFYTEKELSPDQHCLIHERPTEWQSEENVFFRLSSYQQPLLDWYDSDPASVRPETRRNEVRSFVAGGLRDLSVSRTQVDWGVPFPGREGHTVYVWLDALTNYISALGFGAPDPTGYERWWGGSRGQRLHLIGKDILRFHAVYWPAFLMSAGLPLPTTVYAHGWWLRDDRKMSKSVGNVARPDELIARFGADSLRYFLLRDMVFGQDASFSDEAFIDRYNSDLANGLGNTLNRLVTLSRRAFDGATPPQPPADGDLAALARRGLAEYREGMEGLAFHRALESLWRVVSETNQYLVQNEPWKKLKDPAQREEVGEVLATGLEAVRLVAAALHPVLPETAPRVLAALGIESQGVGLASLEWGGLPASRPLPERPTLFPRIDKDSYFEATAAAEPETQPDEDNMIDFEQFMNVELRVANVQAAEEIPKSKKLLKLTLELDGVERTVVAGIKQQYSPEDLVGRQVVVVANLKPAKLMGVESNGMVLAASVDGEAILLAPEREVPSGTQVR